MYPMLFICLSYSARLKLRLQFGFQHLAQGHWGVMWHLLRTYFHGQSFSALGSKEAHRPFTQFLAEFKTDPPFITPPPSFLAPSISAHRPLTTDMCEECVVHPLYIPSPPTSCVYHPLLTSVSCKSSSHTLSLVSCFPLTLPLHLFFLSCLRVVSCDQSGGDKSTRMWWPHHIRLRAEGWRGTRTVLLCHMFLTDNNTAHPSNSTLFPKTAYLFHIECWVFW